MALTFCVWNRCNNNCIMCTNSERYQNASNSKGYTKERIIERINERRNDLLNSNEEIGFTGGEPTIHPNFLDILYWVRDNFSNVIVIVSNGRRFCYSSFSEELLKISNLKLQIAIHGYDDITHDSITRIKGSFSQTVAGIKNLLRHKNQSHYLELRIILIKKNYKNIDKIYNFIYRNFPGINNLVLIFNEIEGRCEDNLKSAVVTHTECRPYVQKAVDRWGRKFSNFGLYHFPLCALDDKYWEFAYRTLPDYEVTFLEKCTTCLYKKYCLGVHFGYLKNIGEGEFEPIKKKVRMETCDNFHRPIIRVIK